jgi:hypothetical protein
MKKDWRRSYEKTHIIFLAETEEAADLGGTLGTETLGVDNVGKTGNVSVALLDDAQSKDGEVHADDATADRLPLALSGAAGAVAGVALTEKKAHTGWVHNTLLHRETLLVVAAGDAEDVALELVADRVSRNLLSHATLHEDAELALIFDLDQLLGAIVGVGNVELHLDGGVRWTCCAATLVVCRGGRNSRRPQFGKSLALASLVGAWASMSRAGALDPDRCLGWCSDCTRRRHNSCLSPRGCSYYFGIILNLIQEPKYIHSL